MFAFSAFARPHTDYYFILLSDVLKRLRFPVVIVFDYGSLDESLWGGLTRKHVYRGPSVNLKASLRPNERSPPDLWSED